MSKTIPTNDTTPADVPSLTRWGRIRRWLCTWELYPILVVATFLRFYRLDTTEFDDDQATILRMGHDAIAHGLLPVTSNIASIGIVNPPGPIYFYMLPATLSTNPLWAVVLVGIFSTAAVLLTYLFTRRYYGRLAGIVAALLYATAATTLTYARFIWQPNLMSPFVLLFMVALFYGVVERRKGWLFPALFLLGILYQMHETSALLIVPLLVALILAPGTIRWRDLGLALVFLLIIFFPYLLWEIMTKFADALTVFTLEKQNAAATVSGNGFYQLFIKLFHPSAGHPQPIGHSLVQKFSRAFSWLHNAVLLLILAGVATAGVLSFRSQNVAGSPLYRGWWIDLRANPYRSGLVLLLVWQIIPLLLLLLHASIIPLYGQYFLMLMPAPFILIGLFISKLVQWSQKHRQKWGALRYCTYALICLVIIVQAVESTATIIDASTGNISDRADPQYPYHNDLASLQHAITEADQLAQQRHLHRVYITTDKSTKAALSYLAKQMQIPATLFDASHCLVLPNPADGPAVLLVGPYDELTNALLSHFAKATLVDQAGHLGGPPFRLYVVTPASELSSSHDAFVQNLHLIDNQMWHLSVNDSSWLVTRWSFIRSEQPSSNTTYNYSLTAYSNGNKEQGSNSLCALTSIRPGDQLLVAFDLTAAMPTSVTIEAQSFTRTLYNPWYGPLHLETDNYQDTPRTLLQTADGKGSITISGWKDRTSDADRFLKRPE